MDRDELTRWVDGYRRAWETNDPGDVGGLFTDDATYRTAPGAEPWAGRDAIVEGWIEAKDDPGTWSFDFDVLAIADDLGFVQGLTTYAADPPRTYDNLWVIRLAEDGRCRDYTEWYVKRR